MIQVPVTWDSANRKKDKSVSLRFTSNFEVSHEDFAEMDKIVGSAGWVVFKDNESIKEADIPKEDAPVDGKKPSQRLRGALWHYWDKNTDKSQDFEQYYAVQMEKIIDQVKERI